MPGSLTRFTVALLAALPAVLAAQHTEHAAPATTRSLAELSESRTASGTAWIPDADVVPGWHVAAGSWTLMGHGAAFLQYVQTLGTRGNYQLGLANWVMLMAARPAPGGRVRLRFMTTLEPFTLPDGGYPQLLQVAHEYRGAPATDRQHPHELFAEISAAYDWATTEALGVSVYGAVVGEPALGPVAYNHRPGSAHDPTAPLAHVAQDYTHESLGVVTIGAFGRRARLEASLFNGSHPDEDHANLDLQGGQLDAVSGRLTWAPSTALTASAWWAALPAQTGEHAHEAEQRFGAAVLLAKPRSGRAWSTTFVYGAVAPEGDEVRHTALIESSLDLSPAQAIFGRVEFVQRTAEELALTGSVPERMNLMALSIGSARRLWRSRAVDAAVGARVTANLIPAALEPFYGSPMPFALLVYLRVAPPSP